MDLNRAARTEAPLSTGDEQALIAEAFKQARGWRVAAVMLAVMTGWTLLTVPIVVWMWRAADRKGYAAAVKRRDKLAARRARMTGR
ncbi:hypothetical protein [Streptomyces sp. NPDC054783]